MVNSHTAVAIALTAVYAPVTPFSLYLCVRNWKKGERLLWYGLGTFTTVRLTSGVLGLVLESRPSDLGLIVANVVLLNLGLLPLLLIIVGLLHLVVSSFSDSSRLKYLLTGVHIIIFTVAGLIGGSGGLVNQPASIDIRVALVETAYILCCVVILIQIQILLYLYKRRELLTRDDALNIMVTLMAMPAVVVRAVYGVLNAFTSRNRNSTWNPMWGSAVALALMALLPEFLALICYCYIAYRRTRARDSSKRGSAESGYELTSNDTAR